MAITQNDFSAQPDKGYAGQCADTSPQLVDSKTAEPGSKFKYGDIAVISASGDGFAANFDGSQTYFEGIIPRLFRKGNRPLTVTAPGHSESDVVFESPDTLDLTIKGAYYVIASEAVSKGPAAFNDKGEWVAPAAGMFTVTGSMYEESVAKGEVVKMRLVGTRTIETLS